MEKPRRGRPPTNYPDLIPVQAYIYQPERDRLAALSVSLRISASQIVRWAVEEYLDRHCQTN